MERENKKSSNSTQNSPKLTPEIEYINLDELSMWLVTITDPLWAKDFKIEYPSWELEDLVWIWDSYLWMIDKSKWDWSVSYITSWKKMEINSKSIWNHWSVSISNVVPQPICETLRGAKFYRPYNSECVVGDVKNARLCSWVEMYENKACLKKLPLESSIAFVDPLIEKWIKKWRAGWADKMRKIAEWLKWFIRTYPQYEDLFTYLHDYIVFWFNLPDVTKDFRTKLLQSWYKMDNLRAGFDTDKYIYFLVKVWPGSEWDYKNNDVNDWWYRWYKYIELWWSKQEIDVPGNIAFWYSAAAWWIPINVQIDGAKKAQVMVDVYENIKWLNLPLYDERKMLENEESDARRIIRWYLLFRKYWLNLPNDYMHYIHNVDTSVYENALLYSQIEDQKFTLIELRPTMDLVPNLQ